MSAPLIRERHVKLARRLRVGADPNPLKASGRLMVAPALGGEGARPLRAGPGRGAYGRVVPGTRGPRRPPGNKTPMVAIEALSLRPSRFPALAVVRALLRGGAHIDRICGSEDVEMRMWRIERLTQRL